jgi:hypothetical protein
VAPSRSRNRSPTIRIYDRSGDQLTLQEIERVQIGKKQEI